MTLHGPSDSERQLESAMSLHGKMIVGTLRVGDSFGLDFEGGTSLVVAIRDGHLSVEYSDKPL